MHPSSFICYGRTADKKPSNEFLQISNSGTSQSRIKRKAFGDLMNQSDSSDQYFPRQKVFNDEIQPRENNEAWELCKQVNRL